MKETATDYFLHTLSSLKNKESFVSECYAYYDFPTSAYHLTVYYDSDVWLDLYEEDDQYFQMELTIKKDSSLKVVFDAKIHKDVLRQLLPETVKRFESEIESLIRR